jgi:hypothetical protein
MDRLEEIVEALEQTDEIGVAVGRDEALLIARLLRAGAEMRSSFGLRLEDGEPEANKVDYVELGEAGKAWDAALGEVGEGK